MRPRPRWSTPVPRGIAGTYGDQAIAWAGRELGLYPTAWQAREIRHILRHDEKGDLVHAIALVSTARQNGKSVIVRVIVGWLMDEGQYLPAFTDWPEVLLAAHDANQANVVYRKIMGDMAGVPRIKAKSRLTQLYGLESGHLAVNRVTHIPGSARGRSAGLVAFDEVLTQVDFGMWEVLQPVVSSIRNGLILMTSTAGDPSSVLLRAHFDRLRAISDGAARPDRRFYGAWYASDDPEAGMDRRAIRQANPAIDEGRPRWEAVKLEYETLPQTSWRKERLNHWAEQLVETAFSPAVWARLRTPAPLLDTEPPYYLGIDIQPGWDRATVAAAALRPDGRVAAEVVADLVAEPGAPLTAQRLIDAVAAFPHPAAVIAYDSVSPAAAEFARYGETAWGQEWRVLLPHKVVAACMDTTELVHSGRLAVDDPLLDQQALVVGRRNVGQDGAFRFSRAHSTGAIDAFMAMTFAAHCAISALPPPAIV